MKKFSYALILVVAVMVVMGLSPHRVRRVIPPDARLNGKVVLDYDVNWVVPERVLVDEVEEAARNILLRRFPGRYSIKAIYPLCDGEGDLAGYAVEFKAAEAERRIYRNGLPPLQMIVFSARRFMPPILWESYSVGMSHLLGPFRRAGLRVDRIVLAAGPGFYFRAGGRYWTAGGRPVDESVVRSGDVRRTMEAFGFTLKHFRRERKAAEFVRDWQHVLLGYDPYKDKVAFTELEFFVPVYVQKLWDLEGLRGMGDLYWDFVIDHFLNVAALVQYGELVYRGRRYGMRKTEIMDLAKEKERARNENGGVLNLNAHLIDYDFDYWWDLGVLSSSEKPNDRWSWESEILWEWGERNRYFWHTNRSATGLKVAGEFVRSKGYEVKTWYWPPDPFETDMWGDELWQLWHDWHVSFLKKRIIGFDVYDLHWGVFSPDIITGGWSKTNNLVGLYNSIGTDVYWFYGYIKFYPGVNFYHPVYSVGRNYGYLMPPREFTNIPPALGIPSRVIAYEGEEIEFEVGVWDAEGDSVSWVLEEFPFKVEEKRADYLRFKIDKPAGAYYAWVRYSDGHNTVYHPIHFLLRPTLYLGGGQ